MKFFFALVIVNTIGFSAQAADPQPTLVSTTFKNIYVPKGFDSNDNVQIAAEGVFTSSCFKVAPPVVTVDEVNKSVTVDAKAFKYNGMCMQILIPFQQVIDIGIIKTAGQYRIQDAGGAMIGRLEVAEARSSEADDYFYAPVQRVSFEDGPNNVVSLRIEFSHSCLQLSEVKVDKQQNVIVLQPISKLVSRFGCAMGYYPVVREVPLGAMNRGRYLLHVRSSGSQAYNQMVAIE